ncbi:MAG: nicotinate (nicotinamide) nucleotide adenylyltransferase [Elainella sp. Prado103]|jgi:nicotinate-nucleotide adenylyltransferase|nr:nicotinate (nicotinamide) nucleotide adenylyltransferase [Elainella sp. Prado103]
MKKIAIFGGAFDPVHWGHLRIAEAALDQAQLDLILWVPSYQPPHKSSPRLRLSYPHRLAMIHLAVAEQPHFGVSTVERDRQISYGIETLRNLQQLHPAAEWAWITGVDQFQMLPHWLGQIELARTCRWLIAPRRIAGLNCHATPAVTPRGTTKLTDHSPLVIATAQCEPIAQWFHAQSVNIQWQVLDMPTIDLSSSLIRSYCQQGRSIRDWVPEPVRLYLEQNPLYGSPAD